MAAAAEHSSSSSSERNPERSSSPLLTREVLCEIFRSLHTLTGQVSGGAARGGSVGPVGGGGLVAAAGMPGAEPRGPGQAPAQLLGTGECQLHTR